MAVKNTYHQAVVEIIMNDRLPLTYCKLGLTKQTHNYTQQCTKELTL